MTTRMIKTTTMTKHLVNGSNDNDNDNDNKKMTKRTTTKHLVNGGGNPENLAVGVDEHVGLVPDLVVPVGAENVDEMGNIEI